MTAYRSVERRCMLVAMTVAFFFAATGCKKSVSKDDVDQFIHAGEAVCNCADKACVDKAKSAFHALDQFPKYEELDEKMAKTLEQIRVDELLCETRSH